MRPLPHGLDMMSGGSSRLISRGFCVQGSFLESLKFYEKVYSDIQDTSTYTQMPEAFILAQDSRPTAGVASNGGPCPGDQLHSSHLQDHAQRSSLCCCLCPSQDNSETRRHRRCDEEPHWLGELGEDPRECKVTCRWFHLLEVYESVRTDVFQPAPSVSRFENVRLECCKERAERGEVDAKVDAESDVTIVTNQPP